MDSKYDFNEHMKETKEAASRGNIRFFCPECGYNMSYSEKKRTHPGRGVQKQCNQCKAWSFYN